MDVQLIRVLLAVAFFMGMAICARQQDRETEQTEARERARREGFDRFLGDARRFLAG